MTFSRYKLSWAVFAALVLFAVVYVKQTAPELPAMVASHFDAAGQPNAFMTRSRYVRFVLIFATAVPIGVVGFLALMYSRATEMKLPNPEYWLAPERLGTTRALLAAHAAWFGSLIVSMACFVHWLELGANSRQPPHLSNEAVGVGLLAFFLATAAWIGAITVTFRKSPPGKAVRNGRP